MSDKVLTSGWTSSLAALAACLAIGCGGPLEEPAQAPGHAQRTSALASTSIDDCSVSPICCASAALRLPTASTISSSGSAW